MTEVIMDSGTLLYTNLSVGEVRTLMQGGTKTGTFDAFLDSAGTLKIIARVQAIKYINTSGTPATPGNPVSQVASKITGPTLIDTVPFSAFTVSTTLFKQYSSVMNRGAKKRSFVIVNTLNQPLTSCGFSPFESTVRQGTSINGDGYTSGAVPASAELNISGDAHTALTMNVDSIQFNLAMGATAPTSGNVYLYVIEIF